MYLPKRTLIKVSHPEERKNKSHNLWKSWHFSPTRSSTTNKSNAHPPTNTIESIRHKSLKFVRRNQERYKESDKREKRLQARVQCSNKWLWDPTALKHITRLEDKARFSSWACLWSELLVFNIQNYRSNKDLNLRRYRKLLNTY